ncbi:hypothetical protein [Nonomuraea salmonea]|uniref:hypothetical protein n=1 Tax=Nonomuraea salmonea TaxID=46181 RepID=UPI0031F01553
MTVPTGPGATPTGWTCPRKPRRTARSTSPRTSPPTTHPAASAPRSTRPPPPEADEFVEQRLLGIREMSNQAIGSIDDLLQHTV